MKFLYAGAILLLIAVPAMAENKLDNNGWPRYSTHQQYAEIRETEFDGCKKTINLTMYLTRGLKLSDKDIKELFFCTMFSRGVSVFQQISGHQPIDCKTVYKLLTINFSRKSATWRQIRDWKPKLRTAYCPLMGKLAVEAGANISWATCSGSPYSDSIKFADTCLNGLNKSDFLLNDLERCSSGATPELYGVMNEISIGFMIQAGYEHIYTCDDVVTIAELNEIPIETDQFEFAAPLAYEIRRLVSSALSRSLQCADSRGGWCTTGTMSGRGVDQLLPEEYFGQTVELLSGASSYVRVQEVLSYDCDETGQRQYYCVARVLLGCRAQWGSALGSDFTQLLSQSISRQFCARIPRNFIVKFNVIRKKNRLQLAISDR